MHINKIRKYHPRIEDALVNNCSVIYEGDRDFGPVDLTRVETDCPLDFNQVDLSHLSLAQAKDIKIILSQFPEVFSKSLEKCNLTTHKIKLLPDFKPKRFKAYRIPELLKSEVTRQLDEMLNQGIIVPSQSEMVSSVTYSKAMEIQRGYA